MNIRRGWKKLNICYGIFNGTIKPTFSQFGEDRILEYLFTNLLKIDLPSYIDIGANHPIIGNNTYGFYFRGGSGILIEPDPYFFSILKKRRERDKIINAGIGLNFKVKADFYVYAPRFKGLNTFSAEEAEMRYREGIKYREVIKMPLLDINQIIQENISGNLDFLSIDVEGLDFEIIQSLDFSQYAPKVICLETVRYGDTKNESKMNNMIAYILEKGYLVYADTHFNTIFCKKDIFT